MVWYHLSLGLGIVLTRIYTYVMAKRYYTGVSVESQEITKALEDYSRDFVLFPGQHPTAHIPHLVEFLRKRGFDLSQNASKTH
jgi:hypothetical protein